MGGAWFGGGGDKKRTKQPDRRKQGGVRGLMEKRMMGGGREGRGETSTTAFIYNHTRTHTQAKTEAHGCYALL